MTFRVLRSRIATNPLWLRRLPEVGSFDQQTAVYMRSSRMKSWPANAPGRSISSTNIPSRVKALILFWFRELTQTKGRLGSEASTEMPCALESSLGVPAFLPPQWRTIFPSKVYSKTRSEA